MVMKTLKIKKRVKTFYRFVTDCNQMLPNFNLLEAGGGKQEAGKMQQLFICGQNSCAQKASSRTVVLFGKAFTEPCPFIYSISHIFPFVNSLTQISCCVWKFIPFAHIFRTSFKRFCTIQQKKKKPVCQTSLFKKSTYPKQFKSCLLLPASCL